MGDCITMGDLNIMHQKNQKLIIPSMGGYKPSCMVSSSSLKYEVV